MRGKAKKLLVLVLTLSLVATFIAPLPVAKANGQPVGENIEVLGETYAALFGMTPTTSENATGTGSWSTLKNPLYEALDEALEALGYYEALGNRKSDSTKRNSTFTSKETAKTTTLTILLEHSQLMTSMKFLSKQKIRQKRQTLST